MPKLGNCLEIYTCAQAVPKHVYTSIVQGVAKFEHKLGTSLGTCVHFQAVSKLGALQLLQHCTCCSHCFSIRWCYRSNKLHESYILPWGWSCKLMLYTRPLCKMITPVGKENGKKPYLNTSDHNTYPAPKILLLLSLW